MAPSEVELLCRMLPCGNPFDSFEYVTPVVCAMEIVIVIAVIEDVLDIARSSSPPERLTFVVDGVAVTPFEGLEQGPAILRIGPVMHMSDAGPVT